MATPSRRGERAPLMRAWTRLALIKELALGQQTQHSLAEKYGVSDQSISEFKQKHKAAIADVLANADAEFSGILLAQKSNRLSMYQGMIEAAEDNNDHKGAAKMLRQMAEELGHLPTRLQVSGQLDTKTKYVIEGVDLEGLR